MPRKPAHEQFDTLQTLRDQAFDLFGRNGYEGVSIGDIALAAKVSKGALYWHFRGKEELYLDCLQRLHALFEQYLFEPIRRETDPVLSVLTLFRGLERLVRDPRVENGIGGYWLIPITPATERLITAQRAFEAGAQATIADAMERGIVAGRFDMGQDRDDMARAVISIVEAVILPLRHMSAEDVHRILAVLARTFFRAYAKGEATQQLANEF